jgi:putative transposase
MGTAPVRVYGYGHLHFITFSCYQRLPLLGAVRSRNIFVRILAEVRERHEFALVGYVVMPEHIHLLMSEPARGTPSIAIQVLKQRVSRGLRATPSGDQTRYCFRGDAVSLPRFWQRRFYDFDVWSAKKIFEKLEYMHRNPLKRKLVAHPKDWPWSSFSCYSKEKCGLIRIDPVV